MSEVSVEHLSSRQRYQARVGDEVAGFAAYETAPGLVVLTHTEVDDAFAGRGVGSAIARAALDDVRATGGLKVVPRCPFIAEWIARHPDYQDLVAAA